jgi:poly(hydroxyalkanoate) granule-associated protein
MYLSLCHELMYCHDGGTDMAKKTLKKKLSRKPAFVTEAPRDIWLAGLGAFSVAQKEGGKILEEGSKLFEKLVKEGSTVEGKTRKVAENAVGDIKGGVEGRVESIRQQASDNWDKLEKVFEDRVARALGRLGVPTADDIQHLADRVHGLAERVKNIAEEDLAAKPAAKKKTTAKAKPKAVKAKTAAPRAGKAKSVARELKAKTAA